MKGIPAIRPKRLKQTAAALGAGALVAGGSVLGATQAHATLGTGLGQVSLTPGSGPATRTGIRYATTAACPSGFNGSAVLDLVDPRNPSLRNGVTHLAPVNNNVTTPFSGRLNGTFGLAEQVFPDVVGATSEVTIVCYARASAQGAAKAVQDTFVAISADGSTYRETNNDRPPPTTNGARHAATMKLTASPNPATVGQFVTLTAHVTPSSATGSVQFSAGGTAAGSPVPVRNGWAAATTSFAVAGTEALSAVYIPTGKFGGSIAHINLTVNSAPPNTGIIPLAVTVPSSGSFTLTVDTMDTVTLTVNGDTAAAATTPIVVSDTRNTFPGWSVSGQDTAGSGATISGNQLGWIPTTTSPLPQGVTLGGPVAPASPGLGNTPAVLALVHAGLDDGYGTITLGAHLTLAIPTSQATGLYTSGLNITSVSANP
jgi:hypothetical protein